MKSNPQTFKAVPLYLYEDKVYDGYINELGQVFYNGRIIARRLEVELTQDSVYKTQFYSEKLSHAILPKTLNSEIYLYDINGDRLSGRYNMFELDREHSSILFNTEPITLPVKASAIIYEAEEGNDVLLTNGENTMAGDYIPTKDKHVVTKDFLDSKIDALKAGMNTLENFNITQGGKDLIRASCYVDNQKQDVILISASSKDVTIDVSPFICDRQFIKEETKISVKVGPIEIYAERLVDVIAGSSQFWKLTSTKNIFDEGINPMYWLNGYQVTFPSYMYLYSLQNVINDNPVVEVVITVTDGNKTLAAKKLVGLDEEIKNYDGEVTIDWVEADLLNFKNVYVSGVPYLPATGEDFALPVSFRFTNRNLRYFRPNIVAVIGTVVDGEDVVQKELELLSHEPYTIENTYGTNMNIKINDRTSHIFMELYNIAGTLISRTLKEIDCLSTKDEEKYRVNTPHSNMVATIEQMTDWDPKALPNQWDMILRNGIYTSDDDHSALAFKIPTFGGHYSHINIDAEFDGKMQIMSSGNTAWLDCANLAQPFKIPSELNDPCKLGEGNTYTFGQVVYSTPVYVRFTKCTRVKINGFELN